MPRTTTIFTVLMGVATFATTQPRDGDLVLAVTLPTPTTAFLSGNWKALTLSAVRPRRISSPSASVCKNLRGKTDANGDATAAIQIPGTPPPNLGLTIFVAGVLYDTIRGPTVTDTHWFVL